MALTGYTRSGSCVEYQDDSGSHHICIDLSSTTGGDFCEVTGQSDWCSSYLPCDTTNDDGNSDSNCPVEDWCVCQWAFASYIENAGGCDYIQELKCDAINMEAVNAYTSKAGGSSDYNKKYTNALDCLVSRCGIELSALSSSSYFSASRSSSGFFVCASIASVVIFAGYILRKRNQSNQILPGWSNKGEEDHAESSYSQAVS